MLISLRRVIYKEDAGMHCKGRTEADDNKPEWLLLLNARSVFRLV